MRSRIFRLEAAALALLRDLRWSRRHCAISSSVMPGRGGSYLRLYLLVVCEALVGGTTLSPVASVGLRSFRFLEGEEASGRVRCCRRGDSSDVV